jgi:folate-binding protein YgfZ
MPAALAALHTSHHARFGEVQGVSLPLGYGDFPGEVEAIERGLGVLDLEACGVLLVRGPDAAAFLNGLLTSDVQRLPEGHAQAGLLCATKGQVRHAVRIAHLRAGQYLLVTEPGEREAVAGHLDGYLIREDAEIGQVPLVRLDLLGPQAEAGLRALGRSTAQPVGTWREAPLLAFSQPLGALPRALVLLPAALAADWSAALLAAVPAARLVGFEAFDEARIRAGVPRFGVDYGRDELPAEAALYDHIAFNKGCYVGQEVHARLHYRGHVNRKLCAVVLPAEDAQALAPGAELYAAGEAVGRLTSLARLPVAGERRGIAMVRYKVLEAGTPLAATPAGPATLRTAPLATDLGAGLGAGLGAERA